MPSCNSMVSTFGQTAILIGSQRDSFAAVAHRLAETSFRGATVKEIKLSQGKVALVDDEDFEVLNQRKWSAVISPTGYKFYASARIDGRYRYMHQVILETPKGMVSDHKDGNGLNNTRRNLRIATHAQNCANKPPFGRRFKGITKDRQGNIQGQIRYERKTVRLGTFETEEAAARAYDVKAKEFWGEFAYLNFPEEEKP